MLETIITEVFFLSGFTFTNIHDLQDNREGGEGGAISLTSQWVKLFWTKNLWGGYSKWED